MRTVVGSIATWPSAGLLCLATVMLLMALPLTTAMADEPVEGLGDTLRWLIPASGLAATVGLRDWEGTEPWCYSIGVGQAVTEILKSTVGEHRPNGSASSKSFPSGHTSGVFGGAAFIQQRYGWRYALPAYLGAAYTGWSRVELDRHYPHDVFAGAAVGVLSSYLFTTPYEADRSVGLFYEEGTLGFQINWKW